MLIQDKFGLIARFVSDGLKEPSPDWIGQNYTVGIVRNGQLLGGAVYHDIRIGHDVWLSLYTIHPSWATKKDLKALFNIAFQKMQVKRLSVMADVTNEKSISFIQRLGFHKEGHLRRYLNNNHDVFIFSMLREEYKASFLNERKSI